MKNLMITVATVAILLGMSSLPMGSAHAAGIGQQPSTSSRMQKFKQLLAQLNLSTGQKDQIKQIMTSTKSQLEALKTSAQAGTTDKTQARQIMKSAIQKIVAVLKPAQRVKLRELMQGGAKNTTKT